jgi:hypothetical protein
MDLRVWALEGPCNKVVPATACGFVSGIMQVVQNFLIRFLTIRGSVKFQRRDREPTGTIFMELFNSEAFHYESELKAAFGISMMAVRAQAREIEEFSDLPDDERFKDAHLLKIILTKDTVNLVISIESMTEQIQILLPIKKESKDARISRS